MAAKNASTVPLAGSNDKRAITLTLSVVLDGTILPFQCIYGGKTIRSIPNVNFPDGFSLSANIKHYSQYNGQTTTSQIMPPLFSTPLRVILTTFEIKQTLYTSAHGT